MIHANLALPITSDSQPSLPPVVIDLQGLLNAATAGKGAEDTAQSSLKHTTNTVTALRTTRINMTPPTRLEKGKANIGPPTIAGTIAPPQAITTIVDDITLEDDPDVIELEEEILDRYLALTAPKPPTGNKN